MNGDVFVSMRPTTWWTRFLVRSATSSSTFTSMVRRGALAFLFMLYYKVTRKRLLKTWEPVPDRGGSKSESRESGSLKSGPKPIDIGVTQALGERACFPRDVEARLLLRSLEGLAPICAVVLRRFARVDFSLWIRSICDRPRSTYGFWRLAPLPPPAVGELCLYLGFLSFCSSSISWRAAASRAVSWPRSTTLAADALSSASGVLISCNLDDSISTESSGLRVMLSVVCRYLSLNLMRFLNDSPAVAGLDACENCDLLALLAILAGALCIIVDGVSQESTPIYATVTESCYCCLMVVWIRLTCSKTTGDSQAEEGPDIPSSGCDTFSSWFRF
jgi:hypothetical protein